MESRQLYSPLSMRNRKDYKRRYRGKIVKWLFVVVILMIIYLEIKQHRSISYVDHESTTQALHSYKNALRVPQSSFETYRQFSSLGLNQRVVFLCGPHKTGSTSVQNNIYYWTGPQSNLLRGWAWPVPPSISAIESKDEKNWDFNPSKGFYAMMESLRSKKYAIKDRSIFREHSSSYIAKLYRTEFLKAWVGGYNLAIGTESLDIIVKDDDGSRIIRDLLGLLPWNFDKSLDIHGSNKDISMVVVYRSPRVKHLISIWRETKKEVENFKDWILNNPNNLGALDSLKLVDILLNHGLSVVLIDSSGVIDRGYDISNVIACDVLNVECTPDKLPVGGSPPKKLNLKEGFSGDLSFNTETLDKIDHMLKQYDCEFRHLKNHDSRLTILYPKALIENFELCEKSIGSTSFHRPTLKKRLVCIAEGNEDCDNILDSEDNDDLKNDSTSVEIKDEEEPGKEEEEEENSEYYYYYYDKSKEAD